MTVLVMWLVRIRLVQDGRMGRVGLDLVGWYIFSNNNIISQQHQQTYNKLIFSTYSPSSYLSPTLITISPHYPPQKSITPIPSLYNISHPTLLMNPRQQHPQNTLLYLCHKCQSIPYCRHLFKGKTPTIIGALLCFIFLAIAIWGLIMLDQIGEEQQGYKDGVDFDKSCVHYCGEEHGFVSLDDDSQCCLSDYTSDCIAKQTCYNQQIDQYSHQALLPMAVFFTSYSIVLLYLFYYLLRCIWLLKRKCIRNPFVLPHQANFMQALLQQQRRLLQQMQEGANERLPQSILYGENGDNLCAICYDEFREDSKVIKLDVCGHVFHSQCLRVWMERKITCPLCMRKY